MPPSRLSAATLMLFLLPGAGFSQQPFAPGPLLEAESLDWNADPGTSFSALTGAAAHDAADAVGIVASPAGAGIMETTVSGPGLVSWWWRRTETGDVEDPSLNLYFLYDGNRLADHDDGQRWEKVTIQIPGGLHTLQWRVPPGDGPAIAVVDQVTVTPGGALPEATAMNDPGGVWLRTELGTAWGVSLTNSHDGTSAAEARPTLRDQATSLRRLISGPAQISWWWQLQGNNEDNELKAKLRRISFESTVELLRWDLTYPTPWRQVSSVLVPHGLHVINWRYEHDDATPIAPSPTAAGQIDQFTSVPVSLQEALGLPNQVWTFGGEWQIAASSIDAATPGSITPASLPPNGNVWIESSFTGPVLLRWSQHHTAHSFPGYAVSVDGVPLRRPQAVASAWAEHHAAVPAGLHAVRWTFTGGPTGASQAIYFDRPQILPPLAEDLRLATGASSAVFFESGAPASQIVPNPPNGPEGATALRLSGANSPLLVIGNGAPLTGPRLVSYFHRRVGEGAEFLREIVPGAGGEFLYPTADWSKRSLFVPESIVLGWDASRSGAAAYEIDGISLDSPAADVSAFLFRTGLNWTTPAGAALARVVDAALPAPLGDVLFLLPSAPALSTQVTGPGVFELETTDRYAPSGATQPSGALVVTANGLLMGKAEEILPDRKRFRFAVPDGAQILEMSGNATPLLRLSWRVVEPDVVSDLAREGLEGVGMTFTANNPAALVVRTPPGSSRRVLTLQPSFPPAKLFSTLTGPGVLSFEWNMSVANAAAAEFQIGTPPAIAAQCHSDWLWSTVRIAIPPGTHALRWSLPGDDPRTTLDLDHFHWEPRVQAANPSPGLLGSAVRTTGSLWRESRNADGEVLVAPRDQRLETRDPVIFNMNGPGMFVCEARLLISHRLPHYSFSDGMAEIELWRDGEAVLRAMACEEWIPLSVPLGEGTSQVTAGVVPDQGFDGIRVIPAAMEFRNAAIVPLRSAAESAMPGISWEPNPAEDSSAAMVVTARGNSVRWHLSPPAGIDARPALTAEIHGPGTLEWESSHAAHGLTLRSNGGPARALQHVYAPLIGFMPSHQLVLPPGIHEVTWTQYEAGFFFHHEPLALSMDVRWLASTNPPLANATSLPLNAPMYFLSVGGWEPVPFDIGTPWHRLRTRVAGPASIMVTIPVNTIGQTIWAIRGDNEYPEQAPWSQSIELFSAGEQWLDFWGSLGDRGPMVAPFTRTILGRIPATSPPAPVFGNETFAQWAARLGVSADPHGDVDGDDMSSLVESALGTDPAFFESGAWQLVPGVPPTVRFLWQPHFPTDVTRTVETSADLVHWTAAVPVVSGGIAEVQLTPPARFARVRAVK
jgi:hypothetical protein